MEKKIGLIWGDCSSPEIMTEAVKVLDRIAEKYGIEMLVYSNPDGIAQGINPFDHGAAYTDIMKTQALKQGLKKYGFTAAFGGGRRDEEKSRQGAYFLLPQCGTGMGSEKSASGNVEAVQYQNS